MDWEQGIIDFRGQLIEYCKGVPANPKGIVVLVHGFAEHMGRYLDFVDFLNQKGYGVYALNHLGHGGSGEAKGHVKDFFDLVDSVDALVQLAMEENNNEKVFMFGHSMGGLVSIAYGIKYPNKLRGQVLSAPALAVKIPKPVQIFLRVGRFLFPKKHIENKVANDVSKDKLVVEEYLKDQKVLKSATVNFYYQVFLKGSDYVKTSYEGYDYPFILLHGTDDKIIDYKLSEDFYYKAPSPDKEIKIYPKLYHELLNEPEKDIVKNDILQWMEKRIKKPLDDKNKHE